MDRWRPGELRCVRPLSRPQYYRRRGLHRTVIRIHIRIRTRIRTRIRIRVRIRVRIVLRLVLVEDRSVIMMT